MQHLLWIYGYHIIPFEMSNINKTAFPRLPSQTISAFSYFYRRKHHAWLFATHSAALPSTVPRSFISDRLNVTKSQWKRLKKIVSDKKKSESTVSKAIKESETRNRSESKAICNFIKSRSALEIIHQLGVS